MIIKTGIYSKKNPTSIKPFHAAIVKGPNKDNDMRKVETKYTSLKVLFILFGALMFSSCAPRVVVRPAANPAVVVKPAVVRPSRRVVVRKRPRRGCRAPRRAVIRL